MLNTLNYGKIKIVAKNEVTKFDNKFDQVYTSDGDWYDICQLADGRGTIVAVFSEHDG